MSLIFVLGNIGGALAAALPEAIVGAGVGTAGAGSTALGIGTGTGVGAGTASAVGTGASTIGAASLPAGATGAAAMGAAPTGTVASGLFGGTSLAGAAGAPTGIAAGAGQIGAAGSQLAAGEMAAAKAAGEIAATGSSGSGGVAPGSFINAMGGGPGGGAPAATPVGSPSVSMPYAAANQSTAGAIPTTGSDLLDTTLVSGGVSGIGKGVEAKQAADVTKAQNKGYRQLSAKQGGESLETLKDVRNTLGGGLMLAEGGEINLQSGQFVIPADIVSDLGNGDTKAGMEFLRQFFETGGHA